MSRPRLPHGRSCLSGVARFPGGASAGSSRVLRTILLVVLSALLTAHGKDRVESPRAAMLAASNRALRALQSESDGTWRVLRNRSTGLPRMLMGAKSAPSGTNAVESARSFLDRHAEVFLPGNRAKTEDKRVTLKLSSSRSPAGSAVVEFREEYRGLPVCGASVILMVDSRGRVVHVTSTADPRAIVPTTPEKTFQEVSSVLRKSLAAKTTRLAAINNSLAIVPGDTPRLVYRATYEVGKSDEPWEYLLDASTGETVKSTRLAFRDRFGISTNGVGEREDTAGALDDAADSARPQKAYVPSEPAKTNAPSRTRVFDPNPVNTLNNTNLTDQNDSNAAVPTNAYVEVDLIRLAPPSPFVGYELIGDFVKMEDIEPPYNFPPLSANGVFAYYRNADAFEEVMCYYHVTRSQTYIQSLGFTNINNRQHSIDAHGGYGITNAWYYGRPKGFGYIAFGDGGVDTAEDADVIMHEYGHSIQDNCTLGKYFGDGNWGYGNETLAMTEGFADYWACSHSYARSLTNGYNPAFFAEWVEPPYLRRIDTDAHYPEDMHLTNGYVSCAIWSGALWDILQAIGKEAADKVILKSHFLVPSDPDFEAGANAILAADSDPDLYGGEHFDVIRNIFKARGIPPDRGTLQFESGEYTVGENGGSVTLTVTRRGGSFGPAGVAVSTADGTAKAPADYGSASGAFVWDYDDATERTVSVPIVHDRLYEGNETFAVNLSSPNGAALGSPSSATVTIVEDTEPVWLSGWGGSTSTRRSSRRTSRDTEDDDRLPPVASTSSAGSPGRSTRTPSVPGAVGGFAVGSGSGETATVAGEGQPSPPLAAVARAASDPRAARAGRMTDAGTEEGQRSAGSPVASGLVVGYRSFSVSDDAMEQEGIGEDGSAVFGVVSLRVADSYLVELGYGVLRLDGGQSDVDGSAASIQVGYRLGILGEESFPVAVSVAASAGYLCFLDLDAAVNGDGDVDLQDSVYVQPRIEAVYRFKNGWILGISGACEHYFASDLDGGWSAAVSVGYSGSQKQRGTAP